MADIDTDTDTGTDTLVKLTQCEHTQTEDKQTGPTQSSAQTQTGNLRRNRTQAHTLTKLPKTCALEAIPNPEFATLGAYCVHRYMIQDHGTYILENMATAGAVASGVQEGLSRKRAQTER